MPAGRRQTKEKKSKVLLIGITQYQHQRKLNNAVSDVEAFRDVLIENYGFQEDDFIECFEENATRQGIFKALRDLVIESKNLHNAIIYFSGHGQYDEALKAGSWVTYDADDASDNITSDTISFTFLKLMQAKHVFLIVDACYSGTLFSHHKGPTPSDIVRNYNKLDALKSRFAVTSGRSDQEVSDGEKGEHSPFAQLILDFLKDYGPDIFPVVELIQHIQSTLPHNYAQQPLGGPLLNVGHQNGQMIFRKPNAEDPGNPVSRAAEIDAFCFSLCKAKKHFKTYLRLFPKGHFRGQAKEALKPKTKSKDLEIAPVEAQPNADLNKVLEKLMKEKKSDELLGDAIILNAEWSNIASQERQGILKKEQAGKKHKQYKRKLNTLNKELVSKGLL